MVLHIWLINILSALTSEMLGRYFGQNKTSEQRKPLKHFKRSLFIDIMFTKRSTTWIGKINYIIILLDI